MLVGSSGYVMGAHISETLLNFARSKFSKTNNLEFNLCDVQTFKFNPNNFDKVISRFGVMFFENPVEAFQNIYLQRSADHEISALDQPYGPLTFVLLPTNRLPYALMPPFHEQV